MVVLGGLILFTLAIYILSVVVQDLALGDRHADTPEAQAQLAERIRPEGRLCLEGAEDECEVEATQVAAAEPDEAEPTDDPDEIDGAQVYDSACAACHTGGVAGAPRTGDDAGWTARLEKGYDTLLEHSIDGFTGDAGHMPARGGQPDLTDEQVAAALDYMLEQLDDEPAE